VQFLPVVRRRSRVKNFSGEPRDGIHLVPEVLPRECGGLEIEEAEHRGPLRPGGPGTLGARPHGAMERGAPEGRAHGDGPP